MKINHQERDDIADHEEFALEFGRSEEKVNAFFRFAARAGMITWVVAFAWLISLAIGGTT